MMKETQISSELNKFEEKVKSKNKRGTKRTRRS